MKAFGTSPLARAVARCAATHRDVVAAYVFGSSANGRIRADSDVDVAVLLARPLPPSRSLRYRLRLIADLGSALRRSDIDLVLLNDASPLLAHRVLSKGQLVFERSRSARVRFQVQTANRYADVIPMYETQIRYLKRQARSGGLRG
jgi:uncharacterized protein